MSTVFSVNIHQQSEMHADALMLATCKRLCCDGAGQRLADMDDPSVMRDGAKFKTNSVCCDTQKVLQRVKSGFLPPEPQKMPQNPPLSDFFGMLLD